MDERPPACGTGLAVGGLAVATATAQDNLERLALGQRARSLSAAIEAAAPLSASMEDVRDALSSGADR